MIDMLIANALVACPLALIAWAFGRRTKSPALAHALWLLVLIKLVSPPLFELPLASLGFSGAHSGVAQGIADGRAAGDEALAPLEAGAQLLEDLALYESAMLIDETELAAGAALEADAAAAMAEADERPTWLRLFGQSLLALWLLGSLVVTVLAAMRIRRFRRLLAGGHLAPRELQRRLRRLARRLDLKRVPRTIVVEAQVSPMLWGIGSATTLVLPAGLEAMLSRRELETLLLHELAHLKRRDHWVRLVELVAVAIYWWNPVLWLCRRELRRREEECCDAWVVSTLPEEGRNYARALVTCIDFVAGVPRPVAPGASAMGSAGFMKRRVEMILSPRSRAGLNPRARLALVLAALVAIPVLPVFGQEHEGEKEREIVEIRETPHDRTQLRGRIRTVDENRRGRLSAQDDLESVIHTLEVVIDEIVAQGKSPRAARITEKLRGAIKRLRRQQQQRENRARARRGDARGRGFGTHSASPRDGGFDTRLRELRELERMERALKSEANARERDLSMHARELEQRVRELEQNQRAIMERREQIEAQRRQMQADIESRRRDLESRMGDLQRKRDHQELKRRTIERDRAKEELNRASSPKRNPRDPRVRRGSLPRERSTSRNLDRERMNLEKELARLKGRGLTERTPEVSGVRARMAELADRKNALQAMLAQHQARLAELEQAEARAQAEKSLTVRRSQIERMAALEAEVADSEARMLQLKKAGDLAAAKQLKLRIAKLKAELKKARKALRPRPGKRLRIVDDRGVPQEGLELEDVTEEIRLEDVTEEVSLEDLTNEEEILEEVEVIEEEVEEIKEEVEKVEVEVEVIETIVEDKPTPRVPAKKPVKSPKKTLKIKSKRHLGN